MEFWSTDRRGAVEIATFSNPPYNYMNGAVINELEQLVAGWQDPTIRAVVLQSHPLGTAGFGQYSVEELLAVASDPALNRYAGAAVRGFKGDLRPDDGVAEGDHCGTERRRYGGRV
jgi:hypothetical protein